MKKKFFSLTIYLLFFSFTASARILILNNNGSTLTGHYRTLTSALAAAVDGDTIYVVGSSTPYDSTGGTDITKAVTIIGPGYFLAENPNTNANLAPAIFDFDLRLKHQNISIISILSSSSITIYDDNITIRRCNVNYIEFDNSLPIGNILILGNFIHSNVKIGSVNNQNVNDVIVSQNFLNSISEISPNNSASYNSIIVSNNVINGIDIFGETVTNNIFFDGNHISNCNVSYNIFIPVGSWTTANNNLVGIPASDIFLGSTGNSTDGQWKLKPGSPAIGSGYGGVDRGMFGGSTPYVLSGVPPIPAIYNMVIQPISTNNGLPGTIKIKSNP